MTADLAGSRRCGGIAGGDQCVDHLLTGEPLARRQVDAPGCARTYSRQVGTAPTWPTKGKSTTVEPARDAATARAGKRLVVRSCATTATGISTKPREPRTGSAQHFAHESAAAQVASPSTSPSRPGEGCFPGRRSPTGQGIGQGF